ncbi:hypothetical protein [Nioella aestuarii]|uniref:hypothetical protein n=1 Tax=Nioella aestuarii TaxID=1662864 RepID=UPI003D7FF090
MTLLKIAIIPVMLLSILWRNHREKRRRADALAAEKQERSAVRRDVVDLGSADVAALQMALDRVDRGDCLVSPRGLPLTAPRLRRALATALMDADRFDEAAKVLAGAAEDDDDPQMMLCRARLHAQRGGDENARALMSGAADRQLSEARTASRGLRIHLAELLANSVSDEARVLPLHETRLSMLGPLDCLVLSGRGSEARALTDEMLTALDRAISESTADPDGRGGGLPRAALDAAKSALLAFRDRSAVMELGQGPAV